MFYFFKTILILMYELDKKLSDNLNTTSLIIAYF